MEINLTLRYHVKYLLHKEDEIWRNHVEGKPPFESCANLFLRGLPFRHDVRHEKLILALLPLDQNHTAVHHRQFQDGRLHSLQPETRSKLGPL